MAIKNRDGSTFRLVGPNPVMLAQDFWGKEKLVLHNFAYGEVVSHSGLAQEPETEFLELAEPETPEALEPEPSLVELDDVEVEEVKVPVKLTPPLPPLPTKKKANVRREDISLFYCLPAVMKETYDPLYEETRSALTFDPQFTFEGVAVSGNDLQLRIWTNAGVSRGSIVYAPSERRWWQVERAAPQDGGTALDCMPSTLQPSFST